MWTGDRTQAVVDKIADTVPGVIGVAFVDLESGMALGMFTADQTFDMTAAGAFSTEAVKQQLRIVDAITSGSELTEIMLVLDDQLHYVRLVQGTTFLLIVAREDRCNIAILRWTAETYSDELGSSMYSSSNAPA